MYYYIYNSFFHCDDNELHILKYLIYLFICWLFYVVNELN